MAAPTIPNGEEYFFPIIYEGNGGGQRVGKFVPFTDNGTIANSVIFNDADNAYLSRTNDAGDRDTFTISVWVKRCALGSVQYILDTYDGSSTNDGMIRFNTDNTMSIRLGSPSSLLYITNRTFEDTSKFYHIMLSVNTGESTAADRAKLYVDGDRITSFSTQTTSGSVNTQFNYSSATFRIGSTTSGSYDFDGYLAEFNQVDGAALTPDTFGLTDTSTGRWIPKALTGITYGTNGFRLQFGSSSALGDDTSGNTNDFSVSNLVAGDQTTDSPTQNHATFDPNFSSSSMLLSEGNLTVTDNLTNNYESAYVGMPVRSGKYYFEVTLDVAPTYMFLGVNTLSAVTANKNQYPGYADGSASYLLFPSGSGDYVYYGNNGNNYFNPGVTTTLSNGDKLGVAYDADTGAFWVAKNNTWINSGNPSTGANPQFSGFTSGQLVYFSVASWFSGKKYSFNFGQKSFTYTPPTGFVALQQDNLPTTDKGIVGLTWIKDRDNAYSHGLRDSSRGRHKDIFSNLVQDEVTNTDGVQKFLKGGIQIEDLLGLNASGASIVAWNWVANSGSTSSNADGSITSTVQANTTAGFSIVQWTGLGGGTGRTIGHGLSSAPEWIVVKNLTGSSSYNWNVYHIGLDASNPSDYFISLNTTNARDNSVSTWNDTAPTSTVFSVNHEATAGALGNKMIAYCWHGVDGFSKFGKYTGNGVSDGPFVYTGFKPAWLLVKANNAANWYLCDAARSPMNPLTTFLHTDRSDADYSNFGRGFDFLSNGFKVRQESGYGANYSGVDTYFIAFAEHPFIGDGTSPVTAR